MAQAESERRRLLIISDTAETVEWHLNRLLDEYTVTTWSFNAVGDRVIITAILLDNREIRKAQIAMMGAPGPVRH